MAKKEEANEETVKTPASTAAKPKSKTTRKAAQKKDAEDNYDDASLNAPFSLQVKDAKDNSVEDRLLMLYKLQSIVSEIDKIKTLRGELPLEVQDLEDGIMQVKTRLEKLQAEIREIEEGIGGNKNKISEAKLLIEHYKTQLERVRNNREFDILSKEVEFQELEVELLEKRTKELNAKMREKKEEVSGNKELLEGRKIDLEHKKKELQETTAGTRQEEERLREKAKEFEEGIETRLLAAFKRIRKGARNGLAVVHIERDACGGCFNKIPPQKQLDIKLRKKIIVCEYCGRIMIDPELAATKELAKD